MVPPTELVKGCDYISSIIPSRQPPADQSRSPWRCGWGGEEGGRERKRERRKGNEDQARVTIVGGGRERENEKER